MLEDLPLTILDPHASQDSAGIVPKACALCNRSFASGHLQAMLARSVACQHSKCSSSFGIPLSASATS